MITPLYGAMSPLGAKARGVFSPREIPGLKLWITSNANLYKDSAKSQSAIADGDLIYTWADQSGGGNDATQSDAAKRPTTKLAIQNNLPVSRFALSVNTMTIPAILSNKATCTVFIGFIPRSFGTFRCIFSGNGQTGLSVFVNGTGILLQTNGGTVYNTYNIGWFALNTPALLVIQKRATDVVTRINAVQKRTPDANTTTLANVTYLLSTSDGNSYANNSDLFGVVVYDNDIGYDNVLKIESYLNTKWSIY